MKWPSYMVILFLFLSGCAHKNGYIPAPDKQAPSRETKAEIRSIGVTPVTMHSSNSKLSLYDSQALESIGGDAALGAAAITGEAIIETGGTIVLVPPVLVAFALLGGIAGAAHGAVLPEKPLHVNPTDQQDQLTNAMFTEVLIPITSGEHVLQHSLVEYGNRITSHSFISIDEQNTNDDSQEHRRVINSMSVNAQLRTSHLQVLLVGEQSSDPKVKLVVKGRYTLSRSTHPDECLGWYSATWTGSSKKLSSWNENNTALLKKELIAALREQSHEAISYLFNSDEDHVTRHQTYNSYPAWIDCYEARYQNIKNYADWFCTSADNGIADSQRRIGDLYYRSGVKDGLLYSYVWYRLAADGNNLDAETRLIQVRQELSTEELKHAEYLLKQWKPGSCKSEIMSLAKEVLDSP